MSSCFITGVLVTGSHDEAMEKWREAWVPAVLEALTSVNDRLQNNVSVYGLPVPLCMDSGSLVVLLQRILDPQFLTHEPGASPDGQVKHPNHHLIVRSACVVAQATYFLVHISSTAPEPQSLIMYRVCHMFDLLPSPEPV